MIHFENLDRGIKTRDTNIHSIGDLRNVVAKMIAEEDRLMTVRTDRTQKIGQLTLMFLIFGAGFAALLIILSRRSILKSSEKVTEKSNLLNLILQSIGDGLLMVSHYQ